MYQNLWKSGHFWLCYSRNNRVEFRMMVDGPLYISDSKHVQKHILPMIFTDKSQSVAAGAEMINEAIFPTRTMSSPSPLAHTLSGSATVNPKGLPADKWSLTCTYNAHKQYDCLIYTYKKITEQKLVIEKNLSQTTCVIYVFINFDFVFLVLIKVVKHCNKTNFTFRLLATDSHQCEPGSCNAIMQIN